MNPRREELTQLRKEFPLLSPIEKLALDGFVPMQAVPSGRQDLVTKLSKSYRSVAPEMRVHVLFGNLEAALS
jgi:hypothetical protein